MIGFIIFSAVVLCAGIFIGLMLSNLEELKPFIEKLSF